MTETADRDEEVIAALRHAPGFEDATVVEAEVVRLGGLTNLVHMVNWRGHNVVVRIPGEGTEAYIDRAVELTNARAAHRAGVSPAVIWGDAESGLMVTEAVPHVTTMTPALFRQIDRAPGRAGAALAQLHRSGEAFDFRFELFDMIEDYLALLEKKNTQLPDGYHAVVAAAEPVREALAAHPAELAPSHCDPLCENFLDDGQRMWIVDWEYSGMNDPLWDLGDVSVEAGMTDAQETEMLEAYFGRAPSSAEAGRVVIYKAMCDLLWTLWGLIQHADDNPAEDFWAYATGRFDRCQRLMNARDFADHVAAVRQG